MPEANKPSRSALIYELRQRRKVGQRLADCCFSALSKLTDETRASMVEAQNAWNRIDKVPTPDIFRFINPANQYEVELTQEEIEHGVPFPFLPADMAALLELHRARAKAPAASNEAVKR